MSTTTIVRTVLVAVLVVSVCSLVFMRMDIDGKNEEMALVSAQIKEQTLRNNELGDLLSEENEEDFYKDVAEKYLGYGKSNEKIYLDITGQ